MKFKDTDAAPPKPEKPKGNLSDTEWMDAGDKEQIDKHESSLLQCLKELKQIELSKPQPTGCFVTDGPLCGKPVFFIPLCNQCVAFNPLTKCYEEIEMGLVGQNVPNANDVLTRQYDCEFIGPDPIDAAALMASIAGGTFDNGMAVDDPATVYIHAVKPTLAHLGDELADGTVSTTCDANVTDVDTGKVVNLEPGGTAGAFEQSPGTDVQPFLIEPADGSVVRVCFCVSVKLNKAGEAVPKPTEG